VIFIAKLYLGVVLVFWTALAVVVCANERKEQG
jgi:hypothetical protein